MLPRMWLLVMIPSKLQRDSCMQTNITLPENNVLELNEYISTQINWSLYRLLVFANMNMEVWGSNIIYVLMEAEMPWYHITIFSYKLKLLYKTISATICQKDNTPTHTWTHPPLIFFQRWFSVFLQRPKMCIICSVYHLGYVYTTTQAAV